MFAPSDPFAALAAQGQRKLAEAGAPVALPPAASPTHEAVLGAVDELLGLVEQSAANGPAAARMGLQIIRSSRGMMLDGLAKMPAEQLVGALRGLRDKIDAVPGVAGR